VRPVWHRCGAAILLALGLASMTAAPAAAKELAGAVQGPALPIDGPPGMPHYRIGVSHLGLTYVTMPWARFSDTSVIYYPGEASRTFLLAEFRQGDAPLQQRLIQPSPEVASLLARHLQGIAPLGTEAPANSAPTDPWEFAIGAMVLAVLSLLLVEDRRRWRLGGKGRSAGKGT
jgi:hypothetical protein